MYFLINKIYYRVHDIDDDVALSTPLIYTLIVLTAFKILQLSIIKSFPRQRIFHPRPLLSYLVNS